MKTKLKNKNLNYFQFLNEEINFIKLTDKQFPLILKNLKFKQSSIFRFGERASSGPKDEWKNQFYAKQSFKYIYSKKNYLTVPQLKTESEKKNSRSNLLNVKRAQRNKKIKESYIKTLKNITKKTKNKERNNFLMYKTINRQNLLTVLETRIDIIICRLNWANSLYEAHSLIKTGQIYLYNTYTKSFFKVFSNNINMHVSIGDILILNKNIKPVLNDKDINTIDLKQELNSLTHIWKTSYLLNLNNKLFECAILIRLPNENEIIHNLKLNSYILIDYLKKTISNKSELINFCKKTLIFTQLIDKFNLYYK